MEGLRNMADRGNAPSAKEHGIMRRKGGRERRLTVWEASLGNSIETALGRVLVAQAVPDEITAQSSGAEIFWGEAIPLDGNILTKRTTRRAVRARVPIGISPSLRLDPTK